MVTSDRDLAAELEGKAHDTQTLEYSLDSGRRPEQERVTVSKTVRWSGWSAVWAATVELQTAAVVCWNTETARALPVGDR